MKCAATECDSQQSHLHIRHIKLEFWRPRGVTHIHWIQSTRRHASILVPRPLRFGLKLLPGSGWELQAFFTSSPCAPCLVVSVSSKNRNMKMSESDGHRCVCGESEWTQNLPKTDANDAMCRPQIQVFGNREWVFLVYVFVPNLFWRHNISIHFLSFLQALYSGSSKVEQVSGTEQLMP